MEEHSGEADRETEIQNRLALVYDPCTYSASLPPPFVIRLLSS